MKSSSEEEFNHFIHSIRNPLNSISLHAELGKMLIDNQASNDEIKKAFEVILQQCRRCEQTVSYMRKNDTNNSNKN